MAGRRVGDDVGAADVAQQRLERVLDDQLDADGGGEVEAGVGPLDQLVDQLGVQHRPLDEHRLAGVQQVVDVLPAPGAEVVEDDHPSPRATSASARCEPMKPAPPVIR